MKTLKTLTALIATMALFFSVNLNAEVLNLTFEEEPYINDIPFNTELVVSEMLMPEFDFEEEAYVDDIPFNTECIAANCIYKKAMNVNYELDEEAYVDDIPFDTPKVAEEANYASATQMEFEMEEEAYINDIPFDTKLVASTLKTNTKELYVSGM